MLLFRKKIDGWDSYVNETISGIFPYMAADVNPDANLWLDVSSVINWDLYGKRVGKDYKWYRDKIEGIVSIAGGGNIDKGFATFTLPEKLILAKHEIGSQSLRVAAYQTYFQSLGQDAPTAYTNAFSTVTGLNLQYYYTVSPIAVIRAAYAIALVNMYLPNHAKLIFEQDPFGDPHPDPSLPPIQKVLASYRNFGFEGTSVGDPMGINDWLYGLNQYAGGFGFKDYPWTPENGLSMVQLTDAVWDIIHEGNY